MMFSCFEKSVKFPILLMIALCTHPIKIKKTLWAYFTLLLHQTVFIKALSSSGLVNASLSCLT